MNEKKRINVTHQKDKEERIKRNLIVELIFVGIIILIIIFR